MKALDRKRTGIFMAFLSFRPWCWSVI